jgi:polyisoprenoid-binding protein YceI
MLTLTGSTQPVTLLVSQATCSAADEREPAHCHANAVLTVKRSTFGMKAWSHSLGDDVTIRIAIFASSSEGVDIKSVKPDTAAADPPADAAERPKTP